MILNDSDIERSFALVQNERDLLNEVAKDLWFCHDRVDELTGRGVAKIPLSEEEEKAIQPLLDTGYEFLGTGMGRIVLRMPSYGGLENYVVKLGRYGHHSSAIGMVQNKTEIYLSGTLPETIPINPVVDWNQYRHRWLVMPYGEPLPDVVNEEQAEKIIEFAKEELRKYEQIDDKELVSNNFIVRNGNVYLTDYGTRGDRNF